MYRKDREDTRVISEIDVEAGRVLWQSTAILNEDIEDGPSIVGGGGRWRQKPFEFTAPVFDTDSSVVLFITKDGPLRVSSDGKLLWRFEPLKGKEPSFIASRDGVVVATNGRDVAGIDASNGRELWLHRGKSELSAIESHDRGILNLGAGECGARAPPHRSQRLESAGERAGKLERRFRADI